MTVDRVTYVLGPPIAVDPADDLDKIYLAMEARNGLGYKVKGNVIGCSIADGGDELDVNGADE